MVHRRTLSLSEFINCQVKLLWKCFINIQVELRWTALCRDWRGNGYLTQFNLMAILYAIKSRRGHYTLNWGYEVIFVFLHIFCLYGLQYAVEIKSQTRGGYSLLKCGAYSCKYIKQIHLKTQRLDWIHFHILPNIKVF